MTSAMVKKTKRLLMVRRTSVFVVVDALGWKLVKTWHIRGCFIFLCFSQNRQPHTRDQRLKEALVFSLRAEHRTFKDPKKCTEHEKNDKTGADLVIYP